MTVRSVPRMLAPAPCSWSTAKSCWRRAPSPSPYPQLQRGSRRAQDGFSGCGRPSPRPRSHFCWSVLGYQNLVTYPKLQAELKQPQVLPSVAVNVGTYGAGDTTVPEGNGLLLFVRIPPDSALVRYTAELSNPAGKSEGSFTMIPAPGQDQWSVSVPAIHRQAGTYTLAVRGITPGGETKNLGSTAFQLQIRDLQNSGSQIHDLQNPR